MAVNEILVSFGDQIKKTRNPFFGTFIIVWIVRNWQLLLTLFNLHLYPSMPEKIEALQSYFIDRTVIEGFFNTAGISLCVLIVTYSLLNVSRAISDLFEKVVSPRVRAVFDRQAVVLRSVYDDLENRWIRSEHKISLERSSRLALEKEREILERELKDLQNSLQDERKRREVAESGFNLLSNGSENRKLVIKETSGENPEFESMIKIMNERGVSINQFLETMASISLNKPIPEGSNETKTLLFLELILKRKDGGYYQLTNKGFQFWQYIKPIELKLALLSDNEKEPSNHG